MFAQKLGRVGAAAVMSAALVLGGAATAMAASSEAIETTDRLSFNSTIDQFNTARSQQVLAGELDWSTDYCSYSPDMPAGYNFADSCARHDFGYRNFKAQGRFSDANKSKIDNVFYNDLIHVCESESNNFVSLNLCKAGAYSYWLAVRTFG